MPEQDFIDLKDAMLVDGAYAYKLSSDSHRLDVIASGFRGYKFEFNDQELQLIRDIAAQNDPKVLLEKIEKIRESLYPAASKGENK